MKSLRHCLETMGLAEHEAAILRGAVKDLTAEGYEAQEAAETAVRDYISALEKERADIVRQVKEKAPKAEPKKQPKAKKAEAAGDKIEDVGDKIGGARKDTATSTGTRGAARDDTPGWRKRWVVSQIVKSTEAGEEGRWVINDARSLDWKGQPRQIGNSFATKEEADAAVPLVEVARNHRVVVSTLAMTEAEVDAAIAADVAAKAGEDQGAKIAHGVMESARLKLNAGQITREQFDTLYSKYGEDARRFKPATIGAEFEKSHVYSIWRDVTDRKRVRVVPDDFATEREAKQYMALHAVEIIETKTSFGEEILPRPDKVKREGPERRKGDAKGDDFLRDFGFRAVEFGNWEAQDERQTVMNHAYDALMDLAEIMGVPPKALGLNGEIALAFGARGQGLSGARAHYERDYGVINLTKMSGAGSLAHEWMHAADHYFGRQDGKASSQKKKNARGDMVFDAKERDEDYASHGTSRDSKMRAELKAAYDAVMDTIRFKAEQYVEDTQKADRFVAEARNDVTTQLQRIRDGLAKQAEYGAKRAPATAEQLARFDGIAEKIIAGEYLDLEWKQKPGDKSRYGKYHWSNDGLDELSAIYKEVRGRAGNSDTGGPITELAGHLKRYGQRLKMLADAQAQTTKTRKLPTEFTTEAKRIDQGRASDYWATPHEMLARAFQSYVEDRVADRGGKSDFLTYGTNKVIPTPWGWARPFPTGEERKAINAAFDEFVRVLDTRETDRGVEMYDLTDSTYYSALMVGVRGLNMKAAQPRDWIDTINAMTKKGVKPDEIEWSGVKEWLGLQQGKVTKDQVLDYLNANGVKVEEVTLRQQGVREDMDPRAQRAIAELEEMGWEVSGNMENEAQAIFVAPDGTDYDAAELQESDEVDERVKELARRIEAPENMPAKFSTYVVPGGTNYREVLLTLPGTKAYKVSSAGGPVAALPDPMEFATREEAEAEKYRRLADFPNSFHNVMEYEPASFRSTHWDQPNVLAHVRVDDRVDADGRRVLFVNEIQSDWAQKGRKEGFKQDAAFVPATALPAGWEVTVRGQWQVLRDQNGSVRAQRPMGPGMNGVSDLDLYNEHAYAQFDAKKKPGIPPAPFIDTTDKWVTLALKRILRMAVDGGYDKVAFITGQQAADLYDLSKQVQEINWDTLQPDTDAELRRVYVRTNDDQVVKFNVRANTGKVVSGPGEFSGKSLDEVVGKDVAKYILETKDDALRGMGLRMGGEGMRAFYDKIVPAAANKLLGKVGGGKVETVDLLRTRQNYDEFGSSTALTDQVGMTQPAITLTDALREKVSGGLPLFDRSTEGQKVAGDVLRELGLLRGRLIESEVPRTRLGTMMRRWDAGKISDGEMLFYVRDELNRREQLKNRAKNERVRGADWLRERLIRARRTGELSSRETDLALWLIDKNPGIAEDVGISIKEAGDGSPNGMYNKLARLVTIFSGKSNALTATHEILHHTERMMPPAVQEGIRKEWIKQLRKQVAEQRPNVPVGQQVLLDWMLEAAEKGDTQLALTIWKGVPRNNLQRVLSYKYASPSEFWAVNGSELVRKRMLSEQAGWIEQAKQWLKELIEKVKSLFGLTSDAPVIRGLEAVLRGDGSFVTRDLISEGADTEAKDLTNQTETPAFRAWFKDSKVVDENGKPLVVYHGTHSDFAQFDGQRSREGDGIVFVTDDRRAASDFALFRSTWVGANVLPVYVKADKVLEIDGNGRAIRDVERTAKIDGMMYGEDVRAFAARAGYDAIAFRSVRDSVGPDIAPVIDVYGLLPTAQIKSAIGNRGTFDPNDPNILADLSDREDPDLAFTDKMRRENEQRNWQRETTDPAAPDFSRADARMSDNYYNLQRKLEGNDKPLVRGGRIDWREFGKRLNDLRKSELKFNLWDTTIGTDFHKAQKSPEYATVFYGAQEYVNDISRFANEASELAPDVLPKMHSLADAWKIAKQGLGTKQTKDVEAASKALFDGTIEDRIWTPEELRIRGLSKQQIKLYAQMRRAIDASLDSLATSELYRLAKTTGFPLPDVRALRPVDAQTAINRYLSRSRKAAEEQGNEAAVKKIDGVRVGMEKVIAKNGRLKSEGYAPLMRFGRHAVSFEIDGEYGFMLFETQRERNRVARQLEEAGATKIKTSTMSEQSFRLFRGMDPNALELFSETAEVVDQDGNTISLRDNPLFQEYLRQAIANRSAMKRLIQRGKVFGYSEDGRRVLAQFLISNARLAAANHHMLDMIEAAQKIQAGDVKDEAIRMLDFVREPSEQAWSAKARSFMFVHFLGGNIASAVVNLSQPITMTAPYLGQFGNVEAIRQIGRAYAELWKRYDGRLGAAVERATTDGILEPHEIHMLYAEADQALASNAKVRAALFAWGSLFSAAEAVNRRATFVAAYRMAEGMDAAQLRKAGADSVYDFAVKAVHETQGIYNRGNRIRLARNPIAAVALTFKQYSVSYVEFLSRLPMQQKLAAMALLLLLSGLQGLPFAEDLDDLIDTIGQRLGFDTNSKAWKDKVLRDALEPIAEAFGLDGKQIGKVGANLAMYGISSLPGFPTDFQGRLGMGNLIPATGLFKVSNPAKEREVLQLLGPAGSFATGVVEGGAKLLSGDPLGAAKTALPVAVQNVIQGVDMLTTGMYRDKSGRRVIDTDAQDAFTKMTGFQPRDVAAESRAIRQVMESTQLQKAMETQFASRIAEAVFLDRQADLEDALADLEAWNTRNPDTPIKITAQQIRRRVQSMSEARADRVIRSTPREIRGKAAEALAE